jgi:parallel beta-helix repeat protein
MACGRSGLAPQHSEALAGCIPSGTEADINAALGDPGAEAVLCPGAVFTLSNSVQFTAPNQRLYTQGFPTDDRRALLRIGGGTLTKAIGGIGQSGIAIQNVQVDGNRSGLDYQPGEALIEIGAASDQTVRNIVAYGTRSWSTIHIFEGAVIGDIPQCQNATIADNAFSSAGTPDGRWADGISLACGNSTVTNNVITDATDGAIVIFGAPGSTIANNTIIAVRQTLLGGINLVDYGPVNGNYVGTVVTNNVIDASGAFIKVGIAMGPDVWSCPHLVNHGATVTNNLIRGIHFGYGYAVNGVRDWTVLGNADISRHVGAVSAGCGGTPDWPSGFQYQSAVSSTLQGEFSYANLTYVLGITEPGILAVIRPPTECGWLFADQGLIPGQSHYSCDGRFRLVLQNDGNLVLYQDGMPLWATNTVGQRSAEVIMQGDGNFVLYDMAGRALWASNTPGHPGARCAIQNDGNLVVYDTSGIPLWASDTGGH